MKKQSDKNVKIVISSIVLVFLAIIGTLLFLYFRTEAGYDAYSNMDTIRYEEILDQKDPKAIVYLYGNSCIHCKNIKSQLDTFVEEESEEGMKFYKIDMDNYNANEQTAFASGNIGAEEVADDPSSLEQIKTYQDIKYQGTPTMFYLEDGVVKDIGVGEDSSSGENTIQSVPALMRKLDPSL